MPLFVRLARGRIVLFLECFAGQSHGLGDGRSADRVSPLDWLHFPEQTLLHNTAAPTASARVRMAEAPGWQSAVSIGGRGWQGGHLARAIGGRGWPSA